jgi:hypothetical protein
MEASQDSCEALWLRKMLVGLFGVQLQDTRYIKYAEWKRNARNDRITVIYLA